MLAVSKQDPLTRCYLVRKQPGGSDWLKHGQLARSSKVLFRSLTAPPRLDAAPVFFLILGIVLVTVGMTVGLGRIGDALVMNNPDAGNFNPANVSPTITLAGLIIGFFVSVGSAMIALSIHKWK